MFWSEVKFSSLRITDNSLYKSKVNYLITSCHFSANIISCGFVVRAATALKLFQSLVLLRREKLRRFSVQTVGHFLHYIHPHVEAEYLIQIGRQLF